MSDCSQCCGSCVYADEPENCTSYECFEACGCCGNEIDGADPNWCNRCAQHTEPGRGPLWELTYFAMYGEDCPYQVGI